jgi:fumarate hydratase subunit alpha
MLKPADGIDGIKAAVIDAVKSAGGQSCPPIFIGLGIGGDLELCALLAKRALARRAGVPSKDRQLARLERELLEEVNKLGIGPAGFGGSNTCLAVAAEKAPGHIASLAVAVNLQCWAHRSAEVVL